MNIAQCQLEANIRNPILILLNNYDVYVYLYFYNFIDIFIIVFSLRSLLASKSTTHKIITVSQTNSSGIISTNNEYLSRSIDTHGKIELDEKL